eukprot:scaffold616_cov257-Pinguiococcus_pyrenoidosus.AAC.23
MPVGLVVGVPPIPIGAPLGAADGAEVGSPVGLVVGVPPIPIGAALGAADGAEVGSPEGLGVGVPPIPIGAALGAADGAARRSFLAEGGAARHHRRRDAWFPRWISTGRVTDLRRWCESQCGRRSAAGHLSRTGLDDQDLDGGGVRQRAAASGTQLVQQLSAV